MIKRLTILVFAATTLLLGQVADGRTAWPYYHEINVESDDGLAKVNIDAETLAVAGTDGADLRLFDPDGVEIPYALRILRDVDSAESRAVSEHERAIDGRSSSLTLDLGADPEQYNQVEIFTEGQGYPRRVDVLGSDDGIAWQPLAEEAVIFSFMAPTGHVLVNRVRYPVADDRYLRIVVAPRDASETAAPVIESANVQLAIQRRGEETRLPLEFLGPQLIETPTGKVSVYRLELPGRLPIQALSFTLPSGVFSREFRLESFEADNVVPQAIAAGRLVNRDDAVSNGTIMRFREVFSRELRLTIADDGAVPLVLEQPAVSGAMRQLVFDAKSVTGGPVRLYYGNSGAAAPTYEFPQMLLTSLDEGSSSLALGEAMPNPNYDPPARPLRESAPWLVYVALAGVCLALTAILYSLIWNVGRDGEPIAFSD